MTNASIKNISTVLSVVAISITLSMGAFAVVAHGQDDLGYVDTYGDNLGYADSGWSSDLGYVDTYGNNLGYVDTGSYSNDLGYVDTYGDNLGYADTYGDNLGYVDTYGDNLGYVDTYGSGSTGYDSYDTYDTTDTYDTYQSTYGYSNPVAMSLGLGYSTGYGYAPISQPTYQQPRYTQPISQPNITTVNTNTCVGTNNCNTTNTNNSINGSFNNYSTPVAYAAPIYYAQPQPIIQYQYPTNYNYQSAYCTITASPNVVQNGNAAYLSWSSNGSSAYLSDGIGAVSANGSLAVRPDTTRTYVLTVSGSYGSNSCSTTVSVNGTAPYVSLSQIPYTGFDYGTVGNTIYWFALAAFALSLAYLALYYKGGMTAFAGIFGSRSPQYAHSTIAPAAPTHVEEATPVVAAHAPTPAHRSMKDTMSITRSADGTPRIVIHRA